VGDGTSTTYSQMRAWTEIKQNGSKKDSVARIQTASERTPKTQYCCSAIDVKFSGKS